MKQQTLAERVEEYLAKREAAPQGKWIGDRYDGTVKYDLLTEHGTVIIHGDNANNEWGPFGLRSDTAEVFIIAAANDSATLLREQGEEIERLRGELEINEAADRRTEALIIAAANLYAVEFNQSLDTFGEALRDLYAVVRNETATIDRLIENDNRRAIRALGGEGT
jgi:hypothetical protein